MLSADVNEGSLVNEVDGVADEVDGVVDGSKGDDVDGFAVLLVSVNGGRASNAEVTLDGTVDAADEEVDGIVDEVDGDRDSIGCNSGRSTERTMKIRMTWYQLTS